MAASLRFTVCSALFLILSPSAQAQTGALRGRILDTETGRPIAGVSVEALGDGDSLAGRILTDASGDYTFDLPSGVYSLVVSSVGYETVRRYGAGITAGGVTNFPVRLRTIAMSLS